MTFFSFVEPFIVHGRTVLDLGAGGGRFTRLFLDRGTQVTAVDLRPAPLQDPRLTWIQTRAEDFITELKPADTFDIIFVRNLIQFFQKHETLEVLLPGLVKHLKPEGILAIQTFFQNPDPGFVLPVSATYRAAELKAAVQALSIIHSREHEEYTKGLDGTLRNFFLTEVIGQLK